jgi:hypothetical protein
MLMAHTVSALNVCFRHTAVNVQRQRVLRIKPLQTNEHCILSRLLARQLRLSASFDGDSVWKELDVVSLKGQYHTQVRVLSDLVD